MTLEEDDELCFPQLFNSSCTKPKRSELEAVLTYITLSSISLLTTTLNMFVIISISHFKQLHTPTNFLLLSLAVSDFFVGLIMFFQIVLIDGCWFLGDATCSAYQYVAYVITSASVGTMVLICVDRYVAICDPLRYSVKVTQGRVQACVCLCWTSAVAYQSVLLRDNLDQPVLYMRVFAVAASQARAMRSQAAAVSLQGSVTVTVKRSELKAAVTLGVVVAVFLVCLCPYFIYIVILTAGGTLEMSQSHCHTSDPAA
ncbi:trace amine-associated receptor 1-like isoform X2 [Betta splendens]|uniref:Trace amine-associated receptor 1-like isoform X2 n=1 Tax=Betta splendens TaxID=158456 RepID=A0A6P7LD37_BETSP|nr:trace amine-associated receptor 1-like isoform X2 [Betta splendens]